MANRGVYAMRADAFFQTESSCIMTHMNTLSSSIFPILTIVLGILTLALAGLVISMHLKLRRFIIGLDAHNISDSLRNVSGDLTELQNFRSEMNTYLANVEERLRTGVRSVHTVRFNPFKGTGGGGNQSFATAFLNEQGDGVLISSLYSREHVSVFSKPIKKGASEHGLSEEEAEALENAMKNLK